VLIKWRDRVFVVSRQTRKKDEASGMLDKLIKIYQGKD
jgi:hypothetical protein